MNFGNKGSSLYVKTNLELKEKNFNKTKCDIRDTACKGDNKSLVNKYFISHQCVFFSFYGSF